MAVYDMTDLDTIKALIPHREPFLLVDKILDYSHGQGVITTEKTFPPDLEVFKGHYPGSPIVPGVLLCEAIFQSGALLMSLRAREEQQANQAHKVPVLTRIGAAKFKRFAGPGDTVNITVTIVETLATAIFFKGKLYVNGKLGVQIDFTCALVEKE